MAIISKKKAMELMNLSNDLEIDLLEDTKKSYKIMIKGDKNKMPKNNFQQLVLDGLQKINDRLDGVEQRLNMLESDIKEIKSLPTIQKEIAAKKTK